MTAIYVLLAEMVALGLVALGFKLYFIHWDRQLDKEDAELEARMLECLQIANRHLREFQRQIAEAEKPTRESCPLTLDEEDQFQQLTREEP